MTGLAQLEREALSSTLAKAGPDAPTLCPPWATRDLAAHLVIRERRPDASPGILLPALADRTQRVQASYAAQEWPRLVDMVREGPPGWNPTRVPAVDDAINLAEFFVHHEDVLRADPTWTPEQARPLGHDQEAALWARIRQVGQLAFRRAPVGVVLNAPGHGRRSVKGPTKLGTVVVEGSPGELVLFGFGRTAVAQVRFEGDPESIAALQESDFGL